MNYTDKQRALPMNRHINKAQIFDANFHNGKLKMESEK
jgi:hypothetical protein